MFIALGVNGGKYGDGLGILGVIIFCIAHVQIVTLNVNVFPCKDDGIRTGPPWRRMSEEGSVG